ncbi:MAG: nicotinate-nucleotide pyrophosphorylase (carboxylating) [Bacteriovoracaceae bacterium]|jgi:nicotinate-nucleotide pyrophosphorylase (carboxylating)
MQLNLTEVYKEHFSLFFAEDDLSKNFSYLVTLPDENVRCSLKIKDDLILAGLPFFFETFNYLMNEKINYKEHLKYEGKRISKADEFSIEFSLPFNIALTGERIALNLLQRASSIATYTNKYVEKVGSIKILDTRKTTPGLRFIEKYAVRQGGGHNHRFGQMDSWMVKDNHKEVFGGVENAINYFQGLNTFYQPIIVEIHDLNELKTAYSAGAKHFLLDNFTPEKIREAVKIKEPGMTYEVSGGVTIGNIESYLMDGIDAFSSGSITYNAPHVDLSLKFKRE